MKDRKRIFIVVALAALLAPAGWAQKPGPPTPPPPAPTPSPSAPPTSGATSTTPNSPIDAVGNDYVMFLSGHVATSDGTSLPTNVLIERVCNARVRQQIYAAPMGDFTMQLGSMTDTAVDASADGVSQATLSGKFALTGIPRRALEDCEVRASVAGFQSRSVSLVALDPSSQRVDVGQIVVQRLVKVEGASISAIPYKAPKDARSAYEKGLEALKSGKLPDARKHFEKAVGLYPAYAAGWFQLGVVLQKQNEKDAARTAFIKATTSDARFLPPYVSLASLALQAGNWTAVLDLTSPILGLDPLQNLTGDVVDLDPLNYSEAYFYNAVANFQLNKIDAAETSALNSERLLTSFAQVHLLLGEIFARKNNYASAISEMRTFLELNPHAKNIDAVRQRLAELVSVDSASPDGKKP